MDNKLKYLGHTASPSDYECNDGELSVSMDLWPENGALKPVLQPEALFRVTNGKVMCVHVTNIFKHYIILDKEDDGYSLSYVSDDDRETVIRMNISIRSRPKSITCIGNTLVVLTDEGMQYILWKGSGYKYLGNHLPELNISFGLQGECLRTDEFGIKFEPIKYGERYTKFSDENKSQITSQVMAKVNKFIAEESVNSGRFLFPFFVRYAYRLYDESLTMHSAPCLMLCASGPVPIIINTDLLYGYNNNSRPPSGYDPNQQFSNATIRLLGVFHKLDYAVTSDLISLTRWKDIIKSVDIFVSAPIYTFDQQGSVSPMPANVSRDQKHYFDPYTICLHKNRPSEYDDYPSKYQYHEYSSLNIATFKDPSHYEYSRRWLRLPVKTEEDIRDDIKDCANFYLIKNILLEELSKERKVIEISNNYLQSLVNREAMTDDYDSHDLLKPNFAFAYNQRLNITNFTKEIYNGYEPYSIVPYANGYINVLGSKPEENDRRVATMAFYVHINQDGKEFVVKREEKNLKGIIHRPYNFPIMWFYYPNVNAYKLTIEYGVDVRVGAAVGIDYKRYEVPLHKHDFLNGAYWFGNWSEFFLLVDEPNIDDAPAVSSDRTISIPNKVYTSEVNNPFYFPLLGINTVGTGRVLGLATAAKALSSGQFGQFPLYAFTTDGVWALEVSSTGTYSARQPITRDVCVNPDSITQIDTAVLFVTERGIMLISGSDTQCVSEVIDNRNDMVFDFSQYKGVSVFVDGDDRAMGRFVFVPFRTFMSGCSMIYDDTSRRLIVFNPSYTYAYVYSMIEKKWGMMRSDISRAIDSYPEALAQDIYGRVLDYSKRIPNASKDGQSSNTQVLVTRPFKLGLPDVLKTVNTVIQRGNFSKGNVQGVLYGSRDLIHWFPVCSSIDHYMRGFRGTPYKYFRLALRCRMTDSESLSGATLAFEVRMADQHR